MPSQTAWNGLTSDEKFLFLINAERTARIGLDYCIGEGPVEGIPFIGVELNIDNIAQNHSDQLIAAQSTAVMSQASAIDQNSNIGGSGCGALGKGILVDCCHTFISGTISFAQPSTDDPPNPNTIVTQEIEAKAVYAWVYGFPNASASNTRPVILQQGLEAGGDPNSPCGFTNDYGSANDEGFLGIGVSGGVPAPNSNNSSHIDIVILTYFDPIPQSYGCQYNCTTCEVCPVNLVENSAPITPDIYQASNSIQSSGDVQSGTVDMMAGNFIQLNSNFEVRSGAVYQAIIDDCFFTLD